MKSFLNQKSTGFYMTLATLLCTVLGLVCFLLLTANSFESSEQPGAVIAVAAVTVVLCAVTAWKDVFHVPSLAAVVMATVTFFLFLSGRISYVAFFLSGDVMGTGLSVYFVCSAVFFLAAMALSVAVLYQKQEK